MITVVLQESTPTTSDVVAELLSCSSKGKAIQDPIDLLSSQIKDLKCAILWTLSLVQSSAPKDVTIKSKKQRKWAQHRVGEVMTEPDVTECLDEEVFEQMKKKKKMKFELPWLIHKQEKSLI